MMRGSTVDGVLDGVGSDDDAVVGPGVGGVDITLEEDTDSGLVHGLDTGLGVAVDLVETDIVLQRYSCQLVAMAGDSWSTYLSVAGGSESRHSGELLESWE